jgi:hypothetical protein
MFGSLKTRRGFNCRFQMSGADCNFFQCRRHPGTDTLLAGLGGVLFVHPCLIPTSHAARQWRASCIPNQTFEISQIERCF